MVSNMKSFVGTLIKQSVLVTKFITYVYTIY